MTTKPITKAALMAKIAESAKIPASKVSGVFDGLFEALREELAEGRPVMIPGIGKVVVRQRPAGTSRNPATGETVERPADRVIKITVSKTLKDILKS